ncbi:MAG: PAS domain-containing sensor histidine kinase [Fimbriimonadaceae bacterium]|nr:PAS domain-containing sensor histidine kinase [Fimbriimonadaceae bacterium]
MSVDWKGLGAAAAWTAVASFVSEFFYRRVGLPDVSILYLPGIAYVSSRFSRSAGIVSSLLSVLVVEYLFELPRYSLEVSSVQDGVSFFVFITVSLLINSLAVQLKKNAEEASRAAVMVEREKARGDLLSAVSHDLRTPLATIEGSASALVGQEELSDQSRQLAASIQNDSQRLARLVGNLLDMTRMQGQIVLDLDWYALDELVANAVMRTEFLMDKPVHMDVDPDVPLVRCDGALVEQIFVNLLENAARHAGKSAQVAVEIGPGDGVVWANVVDDGPGIPAEAQSRLFDRFWGSPGKGAGLGLAICRSAMLAHSGTVSASNRPSGGACFRLEFPVPKESDA